MVDVMAKRIVTQEIKKIERRRRKEKNMSDEQIAKVFDYYKWWSKWKTRAELK